MSETWQFLKDLTNPESIIKLGLPLLLFVIFAETGLLVGFFLPGDSLVFISGLLCATSPQLLNVNLLVLIASMSLAAVAGNVAGYFFGKKVGPKLFKRDDSLFFKKRHLVATQSFYERYGGKTLVLGRFLPYIRTFAPILAGVIRIDFKRFMIYNIAGAIAWIGSICSIGFFLGRKYPQTKNYLGYIVIGLIIITTIPVMRTYLKEKRRNRSDKADH
ncbi:MAG: DedA family protein [Bacteroidia bacterium]